jgi:large subunit ribosomal protein L13
MIVVDAEGLVLGRLASALAKRLLDGEEIIVVNAEKAIIIGDPDEVIMRYLTRIRLNHPRKGPHFPKMPDRIVKRTVRGMLPYQQSRGRDAYRRLKVYIGVPREYEKKKTQTLEAAVRPPAEKFITINRVAMELGAKVGEIE